MLQSAAQNLFLSIETSKEKQESFLSFTPEFACTFPNFWHLTLQVVNVSRQSRFTHSPWFFDDCQEGNVSVFWVWRPEVLSPCVSQLLTVSDSFGGLWQTDYPEFRSCVFRPPGAARSWGKGWLNPGAEGWLGLGGSNQLPHPSSSLRTFGIKEHFQGPLLKISIYNIRGQWFLTFFGWIPCYSGTSFECYPQVHGSSRSLWASTLSLTQYTTQLWIVASKFFCNCSSKCQNTHFHLSSKFQLDWIEVKLIEIYFLLSWVLAIFFLKLLILC